MLESHIYDRGAGRLRASLIYTGVPMGIKTDTIKHEHRGQPLHGMLAVDEAAPKPLPAVIISHAWRGRSQFEIDKAKKLAELGYVGFAADLYGEAKLGNSTEENAALMQPFLDDRELLQSRLASVLDTVKGIDGVDADRVAAIGFCFGGLCVLDLARTGSDVRGVVSFHGLLGAPGNTAGNKIKSKVLVLHGNDDPMVPVDQVVALEKELTEAGADWQIHTYGNTMHAFTNPDANDPKMGTVYEAKADKRSWQSLVNFLEEIFD